MLRFADLFVMASVIVSTGFVMSSPARADKQAPLISELSAPREVGFAQDARFAATVQPGTTGIERTGPE